MPTNPRLSEPDHAPLPNHAEVVVVGSGYGAAVCAARLAEAGAEVVLLERGREVVAGASQGGFPETLDAFVREVQIDTGPLAGGNPQGLFDLRVGPDLNLLVGCGLGGTSLINAAVVMDPEPAVFQRPPWPREIREEAASRRLVA